MARARIMRGLLVGNVLLPLIAASVWYDAARRDTAPPAMDHSGAGLVLLTIVRGY